LIMPNADLENAGMASAWLPKNAQTRFCARNQPSNIRFHIHHDIAGDVCQMCPGLPLRHSQDSLTLPYHIKYSPWLDNAIDKQAVRYYHKIMSQNVTFAKRRDGMKETQEVASTTLMALVNDFLEYLVVTKNRSMLTVAEYRHYLTRFVDWLNRFCPGVVPADINMETVRQYRLYLANFKNKNGASLKRTTQAYNIIALRSFLRYLLVQRDIPTLSPDKIELPKQSPRSVAFLSAEQVERLLDSPKIDDEIGLRDKTILETLFSTGLRVSELVSLNRDQIDLKRREFSVRGKGDKPRVVFLSDTAVHWLERYLRTRRDLFKPLFIRYSGSTDVRKDGERMRLTARSVQRIVENYAKKCGLAIEVTPHTLRHSFATDLLMAGADLRSVQEMLGHESIRTTQVYTHVTNKHLKEVHQAFHSRNK